MSAAATGCRAYAKGLAFSRGAVQAGNTGATGEHKGQSMLVATGESPPSWLELTIFIPPELEQTIWVSVGLKMGDATATPMNKANQTSTRRARDW
jgi:hypothetical protein